MSNNHYYLLRVKANGKYLTARLPTENSRIEQQKDRSEEAVDLFLLLFVTDFDALSYLNTHAQAQAAQFSVEYCDRTQIKKICDRWSYKGVALVNDPLIPRIEFLLISD